MTNADSKQQFLLQVHAILQRVMRSQYLLYALVIHLGLLALLGTWKIVEPMLPTPIFSIKEFIRSDPPEPVRPQIEPPEPSAQKPQKGPPIETPIPQNPGKSPVEMILGQRSSSTLPNLGRVLRDPLPPSLLPSIVGAGGWEGPRPLSSGDVVRLQKARKFREGWIDPLWSGTGIPPATFTCYLAQYADGDWNCNPTALENMLTQVARWSKDRIQASVQPNAISVGSDEIFKTKPPFIFLTGHRDFQFTEKEVENLREYLLIGGMLWADNSLPGRRSRFDEAFRREMKRVFPDRDSEVLPKDHPVFHAHFHIKDVPAGMNGYAEFIEHIRILDESVVIYTQNAYSDLWETALDENNKIDRDEYLDEDTGRVYHKWGPHWGNYLTGFLYRNVNEQSIIEANRIALNIIVHLLTQYEDKFRMIGKL